MNTELMPIGTVVLLKNSTKRVMVIGICQRQIDENGEGQLWDYAACLYPEGYIGADKLFLFNNDQVDKIYAHGYQDEEQFAFKARAEEVLQQLRDDEGEGNGDA